MTLPNKSLGEWIKNSLAAMTVLGGLIGIYVNVTERLTAAESKLEDFQEVRQDVKQITPALARISEQMEYVRNDLKELRSRKDRN